MHFWRNAAVIGIALLLFGGSARAQYRSAAGIARVVVANGDRPAVLVPRLGAEGSRAAGAARGALIGAGVGAAVGVVAMALTPHSDHSEDALGYLVGASGGAFLGLLVGAAIGTQHPR